MISNQEIFLSIARSAHQEMRRFLDEGRTPKSDGSPGYVITLDSERRSFKQALIATAFAGIYFEALTYFIARRKSKSQAEKVDRARYRGKLIALGVRDEALLGAAESFQQDRNDLIHEKAIAVEDVAWSETRFAQSCADNAMEFVAAVERALAAVR
jgi:hypothetical protein